MKDNVWKPISLSFECFNLIMKTSSYLSSKLYHFIKILSSRNEIQSLHLILDFRIKKNYSKMISTRFFYLSTDFDFQSFFYTFQIGTN